jgi:hypothetical protein
MSTKSPSLEGLIQSKGAATRPDTIPQRGTTPVSAPALGSPVAPEPRAKSLTLRLSETQYQRLRRFAFERNLSHQDVIESALMAVLDASGD